MSSFVGGVDSSQAFAGVSGTSFKDHMHKVMEPVAEALGVSGDDLDSELKSGKSLSDVATEKGLSRDDLLAAIKKGLQSAATDDGTENTSDLVDGPSAAATASTPRLDTLATRIADHKRSHGHHGHGHHGPPPVDSSTDQTSGADLLTQARIDPQALIKELQDSTTTPATAASRLGLSAQAYATLLSGQQVDIKA